RGARVVSQPFSCKGGCLLPRAKEMEGRMGVRFVDKLVIAGLAWSLVELVPLPAGAGTAPANTGPDAPIFKQMSEVEWTKMQPELGDASPEMAILHEDSKTHATQLLARSPKALHIRKHWHSANETHTMIIGSATFECGGKKAELSPGGFNYMPARMVHEAWVAAGAVALITVDGPWDVNWVEGAPTAADLTP
ncbi:MAG: AraC family ligand binding domain-containing protein, partial [Methylocella sp.]